MLTPFFMPRMLRHWVVSIDTTVARGDTIRLQTYQGKILKRALFHDIELEIKAAHRVLFITGAGVSADSGLPTYRGVCGLYNDEATEDGISIEQALSGECFAERPEITWKYLSQIQHNCRGVKRECSALCYCCSRTTCRGGGADSEHRRTA